MKVDSKSKPATPCGNNKLNPHRRLAIANWTHLSG
jgi:hypothetical protein